MKTLAAYYSYTGHTKTFALEYAEKMSAVIAEITDVKRPGKIKAFTAGCFAALSGKAWPIQPLRVDMSEFDQVVMFSPVWAGNPPPSINAFLKLLPKGKTVSVKMISASGVCKCKDKLTAAIISNGCTLDGFENIKA